MPIGIGVTDTSSGNTKGIGVRGAQGHGCLESVSFPGESSYSTSFPGSSYTPPLIRAQMLNEIVAHLSGLEGEPQASRPLAGMFDRSVQLEGLRRLHGRPGDAIKRMERLAESS